MPMTWTEPALAFTISIGPDTTEIYRTYKNRSEDHPMTYIFTTESCCDDPDCGEPCIFDIRDLDGYGTKPDADVIADALRRGKLCLDC